jgi:hypothetical protein
MDDLEITEKLAMHDAEIARLAEKMSVLEKLTESVTILCTEMKHTREELNDVRTDIKEIKERPTRRWDTLVASLISAAVAGFFTWIITH